MNHNKKLWWMAVAWVLSYGILISYAKAGSVHSLRTNPDGSLIVNSRDGSSSQLRTIKGVIDDSDAAAGEIGEYIETVKTTIFTQASPTNLTYYDVTNLTLPLTAGDWDVSCLGTAAIAWTSGASSGALLEAVIRDAGDTIIATQGIAIVGDESANLFVSRTDFGAFSLQRRVSLAGSDIHKVSIRYRIISGTPLIAEITLRADLDNALCIARRVR